MHLKPIAAIIVLLLLVASLSVAGCSNDEKAAGPNPSATPSVTPSIQSDKTTFTSTKGYSITYPKNLRSDRATNDSTSAVDLYVYLNPNNTVDGVVVASRNATTGETLQTFSENTLNNLTSYQNSGLYSGYSLQSFQGTTLAGESANKIVWQATVPQKIGNSASNAQMKEMQFLMVHNGTEFVVTYKATQSEYDTYLTQAQEVINSFKFTS
jgi:hypothetical protein